MKNEQNIDIFVLNETLNFTTDAPDQMRQLAIDLNKELQEMFLSHNGVSDKKLLIIQCLKLMADNVKLKAELTESADEREKLNKTLKSFIYNIE
jgi:cell division protein ZapA (FtsZ GTPase activity inhibitor)